MRLRLRLSKKHELHRPQACARGPRRLGSTKARHRICIDKLALMRPFKKGPKIGEQEPGRGFGACLRPVDGVGNVLSGHSGKRLAGERLHVSGCEPRALLLPIARWFGVDIQEFFDAIGERQTGKFFAVCLPVFGDVDTFQDSPSFSFAKSRACCGVSLPCFPRVRRFVGVPRPPSPDCTT